MAEDYQEDCRKYSFIFSVRVDKFLKEDEEELPKWDLSTMVIMRVLEHIIWAPNKGYKLHVKRRWKIVTKICVSVVHVY